jgi:hypothetical protein
MRLSQQAPITDLLERNRVQTPVPVVPGALPDHGRVPFSSAMLHGLPIDLVVVWTIGDFLEPPPCSSYYDPTSPWYNVFYGAYGVLSHEKDGSFWGYDVAGNPEFTQMIQVPELDYNYLTAGQLGCPPAKRIFRVLGHTTGKLRQWDHAEVTAEIPSGLHGLAAAINANPLYYSIFGFPDPKLMNGRSSYEPVRMHGHMYFRPLLGLPSGDRITLVWGAMCPDTADGRTLLATILGALDPLYP